MLMKFIFSKSEPQATHFPPCSPDSNSNKCVAWLYYKKVMSIMLYFSRQTQNLVVASAAHWCGDDILCPVMAWMFKRKLTLKVSKMMCFMADRQRHGQSKGCRHFWLKAKQLGKIYQDVLVLHTILHSRTKLIVKIFLNYRNFIP